MRHLLAVSLLAALAACTGERAPTPPAATTDAPTTATEPASDATVPPPAAPKPASQAAPMPAAGAIGYAGFGPATFGVGEESVRMAWGKDLQADPTETPEACHYLQPLPKPAEGYRLAFMIEGGKFVRIDVNAEDIVAPGGGRIGMRKAEIDKLYAGIEARPHKYTDGLYLRSKDPAGGDGVLVFETDGKGDDARVSAWRIGLPPQVDYVEGCS